jgi:hypothetical protein
MGRNRTPIQSGGQKSDTHPIWRIGLIALWGHLWRHHRAGHQETTAASGFRLLYVVVGKQVAKLSLFVCFSVNK